MSTTQSDLSPVELRLQLAYAADLTRETCVALEHSQLVSAAAQMLVQRFYTIASLRTYTAVYMAGGAVLIVGKAANETRTVHEIASVLHDRLADRETVMTMIGVGGQRVRQPLDFYGADGYAWKVGVLHSEWVILMTIGFRLSREPPHMLVLVLVNTLRDRAQAPAWTDRGVSTFRHILQAAWNFANDALLLQTCVREEAADVASACISKAARLTEMPLPDGWQKAFGRDSNVCDRIACDLDSVYEVGTLRGRFMDYSGCPVLQKFSQRSTSPRHSGVDDGSRLDTKEGPAQDESLHARHRRKRRRFADAIVDSNV